MKFFSKIRVLAVPGLLLSIPLISNAQYCTPTINTSGIHINVIDFNVSGFTGGVQRYTGNNGGFTQNVGSSSGTLARYFGASFNYGIANSTAAAKPYDFAVYADWNNDGDFNDAGEQQSYPITGTLSASTSLGTGSTIFPPLTTPGGNYRVRFTLSQNGNATATACGSYTGEVEDYLITVATNTAPVLNTGATINLNPILSSQTSSNGFSINELVSSTEPTALITDADDQAGTTFYNKAPRGIAVYGQTATNGTWQYKVGAGSWTNFGAVSGTNALLLLADAANTSYQSGTRIRFVPTGVGTPTLSIRAWDGTTGTTGTYTNIASTGGSTAFSTATLTTSLPVIAATGFSTNVFIGTTSSSLYRSSLNKTAKQMANPEPLLSNSTDYAAYDIDYDATNNKVYWIAGTSNTQIGSSNADGSSAQPALISGLNYVTGLAFGKNKIYYVDWTSDYSAIKIFKANTDGSGITNIFTGASYADIKDIEFYKNKLYFQYSTDGTNYKIAQLDTTGSNLSLLYTSTATYLSGLDVGNDTLYWTEGNGTLKKKAIAGGTVTTLVTATGRTLADLVVDPINATIYYLDLDGNSNDRYSLIRTVATTGGTPLTVATVTGIANSLAFYNPATPLPLTLVSFKGSYDEQPQTARLTWETAAEEANTTFTLERSTDGVVFAPVNSIAGIGAAGKNQAYSYNDYTGNVNVNTLYYRLKSTSSTERVTYSNIVALNKKVIADAMHIWPNPSRGIFNINTGVVTGQQVLLTVYSADGRMITSSEIEKGFYQLNLADQQAGVYYLQLDFGGGVVAKTSIVKQ